REYYTRKLDGGVIFPESGIARIFLIYFIQKPVPRLSSDDPVRLILSICPRSLTMQFSRKIFIASAAVVFVFFALLFSPREVRADEIAITSGYYFFGSIYGVNLPPEYVHTFVLRGGNLRGVGGGGDPSTEGVN